MNALSDFRTGIDHAMQSLSEGWQQLRKRAAHALTHFHPAQRSTGVDASDQMLEVHASRWGLLAAEMREDAKNITVKIEVPGMEADDFDIHVIENSLVISGEKRAQSERKEGRFHIMECAYGNFERIIPLTAPVDEQQAQAKYKRGVLVITLPKKALSSKNRISID